MPAGVQLSWLMGRSSITSFTTSSSHGSSAGVDPSSVRRRTEHGQASRDQGDTNRLGPTQRGSRSAVSHLPSTAASAPVVRRTVDVLGANPTDFLTCRFRRCCLALRHPIMRRNRDHRNRAESRKQQRSLLAQFQQSGAVVLTRTADLMDSRHASGHTGSRGAGTRSAQAAVLAAAYVSPNSTAGSARAMAKRCGYPKTDRPLGDVPIAALGADRRTVRG